MNDFAIAMQALQDEINTLRAENARLKQRVAELEQPASQQETADPSPSPIPYQAIFEQSSVPMTIFSTDGTLLAANQKARASGFQFDTPNLFADTWSQQHGHHQAFQQALDAQITIVPPAEHHNAIWFETTFFPVQPNGTISYVVALHCDVTERVQSRIALEQSESRFRSIFEHVPAGICITNGQGLFEYVNPAYCDLYGYQMDELINQPFTLVVPEARHDWAMNLHNVFMEEGREIPREWQVLRKSGEVMNILANAAYITGDDGKPRKATFVVNITDLKRLQSDLRVFQTLAENAPDGIFVLSLDTQQIMYANASFCTMLQYDTDMLGMPLHAQYAETNERIQEVIQEVCDNGTWVGQLVYKRKDSSTFPAHLASMVLHNDAGKPYAVAGIVRDLTEQLRAEAERLSLQQEIIQTQQAAIRELSTPLLPIADTVVALPIIGSVDSARAQQIMETLLEGISTYQADLAIVDITGVRVVDTQVAQALIRTAQAVKLLGSQVILTGIQPQIAQTLVHLGADLSEIITRGNLQAGIAYALKQQANQG
ncbi:MAG: PAS domain S-box protein [Chloroflexaceae bacterium]|nr:PAS domain S-box protein [Chloroflexaceae bacterium]